MPSSAAQSVLFFRMYREAALPLYAAIVEDLCGSPHLPSSWRRRWRISARASSGSRSRSTTS
ncbi:hypothetical protein ACU4GR_17470 [Methylobacterium oryzae CBMB20]